MPKTTQKTGKLTPNDPLLPNKVPRNPSDCLDNWGEIPLSKKVALTQRGYQILTLSSERSYHTILSILSHMQLIKKLPHVVGRE